MTKSPTFVDSTLAPSPYLTWFRTTLIKVNGAWQVAEFAAEVSQLLDLECGMVRTDISDVLTLAHNYVVNLAALGIYEVAPAPESGSGGSSSSSSTRQQPRVPSLQPLADSPGVPVRQPDVPSGVADGEEYVAPKLGDVAMDVAPAAAGEAEALVDDRPELNEPFSVLVDGVAMDPSFPLATIRVLAVLWV